MGGGGRSTESRPHAARLCSGCCSVQQALLGGNSTTHAANQLADLLASLTMGTPAPSSAGGLAGIPPAGMDTDERDTDQQQMLVAQAEGESYICPACAGVVSAARRSPQEQHWCPARPG